MKSNGSILGELLVFSIRSPKKSPVEEAPHIIFLCGQILHAPDIRTKLGAINLAEYDNLDFGIPSRSVTTQMHPFTNVGVMETNEGRWKPTCRRANQRGEMETNVRRWKPMSEGSATCTESHPRFFSPSSA
jgi:hypothetical protein